MAIAAHDPEYARANGIDPAVAKEWHLEDIKVFKEEREKRKQHAMAKQKEAAAKKKTSRKVSKEGLSSDGIVGEWVGILREKGMFTASTEAILTEDAVRQRGLAEVNRIARSVHFLMAAFAVYHGEKDQVAWKDLDVDRRIVVKQNVMATLQGATPEDLHDAWVYALEEAGWVYGETKDPEAKTHPCLVPFEELPDYQKEKDFLFQAAVFAALIN